MSHRVGHDWSDLAAAAAEEIKKTISFTVLSKGIKYLDTNLTKKVKDIYKKNYKTLLEEIEEDMYKWK